jgi:hypothetical protein
MKRKFPRLIILCSALLGVALLSGCTNLMKEDPEDSPVPWATPANWENQVPGMPGSGGF